MTPLVRVQNGRYLSTDTPKGILDKVSQPATDDDEAIRYSLDQQLHVSECLPHVRPCREARRQVGGGKPNGEADLQGQAYH